MAWMFKNGAKYESSSEAYNSFIIKIFRISREAVIECWLHVLFKNTNIIILKVSFFE